jgi:hypothetical protein
MWGWTLRACSLQAQAWKFIVPSLWKHSISVPRPFQTLDLVMWVSDKLIGHLRKWDKRWPVICSSIFQMSK